MEQESGTPDHSPDTAAPVAARIEEANRPEPEDADATGTDTPTVSVQTPPAGTDVGALLEEQRDKYLRLAAEYDNYRRRTAKESGEAESRGQRELVKKMIEALDDLARFAHVDPATTDSNTIVEGVQMVEKKLQKTLSAAGLEIIDPVDTEFDPAKHEAVTTEPAASAEDDHVVSRVFQPGYMFNGQLLRPARVVVRQWNG